MCLPEIEGEEEIGDRGWSDVGFRRDFSCHRAVGLSFIRRPYRAHDRRGWSFHVQGPHHHDNEETSRLRQDSKNYVNK